VAKVGFFYTPTRRGRSSVKASGTSKTNKAEHSGIAHPCGLAETGKWPLANTFTMLAAGP
jgi:hypothetical protein